MYLWQSIAGAFYAPCVDGDFDMTVIAHEYTHAITNRMIAGPNDGVVPTASQVHGEELRQIEADHWAQIGWGRGFDVLSFYEELLQELRGRGF